MKLKFIMRDRTIEVDLFRVATNPMSNFKEGDIVVSEEYEGKFKRLKLRMPPFIWDAEVIDDTIQFNKLPPPCKGNTLFLSDDELSLVEESSKAECICSIRDLMMRGCKCGHLERERCS